MTRLVILCCLTFLVLIATNQPHYVKAQVHLARPTTLRVMTYNINGGRSAKNHFDLPAMIQFIKKQNPTVLTIQEVQRFDPRSHFINEVQVIAQALHMYWVFEPSIHFYLYGYGNAILSKYPLTVQKQLTLQSHLEPRSATLVQLQIPGYPIDVMTTQLDLSKPARTRHIQDILHVLNPLKTPVILTGDFNTNALTQQLEPITDQLHNAARTPQTTYPGYGEIDYIFFKGPLQPIRTYALPVPYSDHYPLISQFQLPTPHPN